MVVILNNFDFSKQHARSVSGMLPQKRARTPMQNWLLLTVMKKILFISWVMISIFQNEEFSL